MILDASGSMWGKLDDGSFKIAAAREALGEYLDGALEGKNIALRAYGHNREKDCSDTELLIPFSPAHEVAAKIKSIAKNINPKGRTPIGRSLMAALDDIGNKSAEIILISDGLETCDQDPCALMKAWKEKNIAIKVHVVGLGLTEKEKETLQCISDISGTSFQDAQSAEELSESLSNIQSKSSRNALIIRGFSPDGDKVYVQCEVSSKEMVKIEGRSDQKFKVPFGIVDVKVGILTRNGEIYKPVYKKIEITKTGETEIDITVDMPPAVYTQFIEEGEEIRGVLAMAYQNGKEVFSLRPKEWQYVMPGTYDFKANINTLSRIDANGNLHKDRVSKADGKPIYLMEGKYQLKGWSKFGNFDIIEIDIKAGDTKSIVMRDKG